MPAWHGRLIIAIEFALADWVHTYLTISSRAPRRGKLDNSGDFEKILARERVVPGLARPSRGRHRFSRGRFG